MSHEFNNQRQCQTCFVCLSTNRQLRAHIEGYRSQERQLLAELEKCRAHLTTLDDKYYDIIDYDADNGDDNSDDENHGSNEERGDSDRLQIGGGDKHKSTAFRCPHTECKIADPFKKRKNLIRHFAIHFQSREICAFCNRIFTYAAPYIAHKCKAREPNNEPKVMYTRVRFKELRGCVSKELDRMLANDESLCKSLRGQSEKRGLEPDDSSNLSRAPKRARSTYDDVNEATNELDYVVEPPGEIHTILQPSGSTERTVATNTSLSTQFSAPLFYNNVGGLTNGDCDFNFSAPLFFETMGGLTGASEEIFHAPIFDDERLASYSTALELQAGTISQQQALMKDNGWT